MRPIQRGSIVKRSGSWYLLYYDKVFRAGQGKRVLISKKLTRITKEYPTAGSCRLLADAILSPINRRQSVPESSLPVHEFVDLYYFPGIAHELKPSTLMGYKSLWAAHLKDKPELKMQLRNVQTVHVQRLLRSITGVGHLTLSHIKNFLSGVFRWAKQEGYLAGINPCMGVKVPGRPVKVVTSVYSIEDCVGMVERLEHNPDACDVIVLLSLTGLRQSECRGLRWTDWNEKEATPDIARAVWRTSVGRTKNIASEATIPLIGLVQDLLKNRRERVKPNANDYIFAGTRNGAPLDLHNLANRVIIPSIEKCVVCRLPKIEHDENSGHAFELDKTIHWEGWHGSVAGSQRICWRSAPRRRSLQRFCGTAIPESRWLFTRRQTKMSLAQQWTNSKSTSRICLRECWLVGTKHEEVLATVQRQP
jgi:integrase